MNLLSRAAQRLATWTKGPWNWEHEHTDQNPKFLFDHKDLNIPSPLEDLIELPQPGAVQVTRTFLQSPVERGGSLVVGGYCRRCVC